MTHSDWPSELPVTDTAMSRHTRPLVPRGTQHWLSPWLAMKLRRSSRQCRIAGLAWL
jgi:hypothetical protein